MIPELGHFALVLAFCLSITLCLTAFISAHFKNEPVALMAPFLVMGQFVFVGISFLVLEYAFVSNDFSVAYVASHSNAALPFYYQLNHFFP